MVASSLWRTVLALALMATPLATTTACSSDASENSGQRLALARSTRGYVESGDFASAKASFDETMTAQVDQATFQQLTAIVSPLGAYQRETSNSEGEGGSLPSGRQGWNVVLQCAYEQGSAEYVITIDDRNLVAGIRVKVL